ncbi:MAG: hypothetical protein KF764_13750 [Labilithrix sp.]|nr:hypothetical protein [Labilithrix sp.]MBX3225141.1 hypothetical protein [Labilithrix sp.]
MNRSFERPSVLVVAAWEPELERFRELCRGGSTLDVDLEVAPIGIGLVDAASGLTRRIVARAPSLVVFVGTCGASPSSGLAIGDVVAGARVSLIEPAVVEGRAAMPFASEAVELDEAMVEALVAAGARVATIASTLAVTTDDALAAALAPHGQVEHLEAYGVARACQLERGRDGAADEARVRAAIVLGVANVVGARGREEWRANHVAASARAAEVAWAALAAGVRRSTRSRSPA